MSTPHTHLLALHGWAGDQRSWQPWAELAQQRDWSFSAAERGYGQLPPHQPSWEPGASARVVLAHSLGPHLLPEDLWQQATAVVLLASFGAFVPPGPAGRPVKAALRAMAQRLTPAEQQAMLREFFATAAAPAPPSRLPPGPLEQGIDEAGRARLLADLALLGRCCGLPAGFPQGVPVLIVEADDDQIVPAASRQLLRESLPQATVWRLEPAGHALLLNDLPERVITWIADGCR